MVANLDKLNEKEGLLLLFIRIIKENVILDSEGYLDFFLEKESYKF